MSSFKNIDFFFTTRTEVSHILTVRNSKGDQTETAKQPETEKEKKCWPSLQNLSILAFPLFLPQQGKGHTNAPSLFPSHVFDFGGHKFLAVRTNHQTRTFPQTGHYDRNRWRLRHHCYCLTLGPSHTNCHLEKNTINICDHVLEEVK